MINFKLKPLILPIAILVVLLTTILTTGVDKVLDKTAKRHKNKLAGSISPYLLQHSGNPVNWFPWVDEAFNIAQKDDIPILLSIGYSSCHWCHVMAHESFENDDVAKIMNENFV
ncbi:MAG: DUF255 domain-containing protein, partial [Calditrichaeota bacterium]|nr:DUF255 domain-containing protein [Calditrichota bacterium]